MDSNLNVKKNIVTSEDFLKFKFVVLEHNHPITIFKCIDNQNFNIKYYAGDQDELPSVGFFNDVYIIANDDEKLLKFNFFDNKNEIDFLDIDAAPEILRDSLEYILDDHLCNGM